MGNNGKETRSALLIRCTAEEAAAIREAAKVERRTVSAYVLRAVMNRMSVQRRLELGIGLQGDTKQGGPLAGGGGKDGPDRKQVIDRTHSAL